MSLAYSPVRAASFPNGGEDKLGEGIIQAPSMEVLHASIKEGLSELKASLNVTDQVPITITADGLLIEMIDKEKQAFFEVNSANVKPIMRKILSLIAKEIKDTPNLLIVAGHTDSRGFHNDSFYSNWELSVGAGAQHPARSRRTRHRLSAFRASRRLRRS